MPTERRPFDPDHCTACGDFLPCGSSWLDGKAGTDATADPVFGPDRPRAAMRAIAELQAARDALVSIEWCFTPPVIERHRQAVQIRAMYAEYADDFRGH